MNSMRSLSFGVLTTFTAAALGLSGCGSDAPAPANPPEVQARVNALLPDLVSATGSALTGSDSIPALAWLEQGMATMAVAFPRVSAMLPGTGSDEDPVFFSFEDAGDEPAGELVAALAALVFNEQSYEGNGYYRLRGELVCASSDEDGALDEDCASEVDRAEIRLHATLVGDDGLNLGLAIGPSRAEPLVLELRPARVSVALDLAAAKEAVAHLLGDEAELPAVMEGVLALSLIVHGADDISIQTAARTALRLEVEPFRFATAAKDPLMAVRFQGASQVDLTFDLGRTELALPWNMISFNDAGEIFAMTLAGMSASTTLRADASSATITNIGLGDGTTTLALDDHVLFALDLNADQGRRFELTVRPSDAELPIFTLSPGFDLSMMFDLAPLAAAGEEIAEVLLGETYRIALTGAEPALQPVDPDFESDFAGGIRVASGTLSISSTGADEPVVVEAGMCLSEVEPAADAHPIIGVLAAVACP